MSAAPPAPKIPPSAPARDVGGLLVPSALKQRARPQGPQPVVPLRCPCIKLDEEHTNSCSVVKFLTTAPAHAPPAPGVLADPYCFEPNDIPLPRLQYQFNERLLAAANSQVEGGGWHARVL